MQHNVHPADHNTKGRQRWESKDTSRWDNTFGHSTRREAGKSRYVVRNGVVVRIDRANPTRPKL